MTVDDALQEVGEYYYPADHEAARTLANEVLRLREELESKTAALDSLISSIRERNAREPLVQEVIQLSKRLADGDLKDTGYFLAAVHKLAEWKP